MFEFGKLDADPPTSPTATYTFTATGRAETLQEARKSAALEHGPMDAAVRFPDGTIEWFMAFSSDDYEIENCWVRRSM